MPPSIYDCSFHCVRCLKTFKKWHFLFTHLSEKLTLNLFACTKCWTAFLTIDALIEHLKRKHVESTDVIGQASPDNIRTDILAHVLICAHCGRHVVVADRLLARQQTNYEQFVNHATKGVYQITVHAKSQIVESILDEIESSFPSKLTVTFYDTSLPVPLKCTICGAIYGKLDDVEQHFALFHKPRSTGEEHVKACTSCGEEFWTNVNYQLHQNEEHTSSKWTLIKFLKLYVSNETAQDALCSRNIQLTMSKQTLRCDLCLRIMEIADFNSHDCAINYTRRLQYDGKLVKCPSQMLKSCSINLATLQNDQIRDFVKVFKQKAILQLKVNETVKFPNKLDTSVNREVWNCRYCDVVFDEDHLEKNKLHLKEIHRILLPANVQRKEILVKHSDILLVTLNGYKCPKVGCATKPFCSLTGLKFHLTFQHDHHSLPRTSVVSNSRNSQLTVGNEPAIAPKLGLEDKTASDKRSAKETQGSKKVSKRSQAIELDPQKSQIVSGLSAPPPPVTLLLHPPPVLDMKPGQYNFFSTKILSGVDQLRLMGPIDKISSGVLIAYDNPSLIYFVCGNHVSSMAMVAENGRTHFAVGSIPPNFKLPENIKVPNLEDVLKPSKDNPEAKDSSSGAMLWECPICMEKMTTPLKNHLMQRHLYFCLKCSACFVTQTFIQMHDSSCNFQHPASRVLYLCTICRCVFSAIVCFYNHLIETHQNGVTFDETTGQVFPYCATICLENDYLPSLVSDAVPLLETVTTDEALKLADNITPVTTSRSVVSSQLHSQTEINAQPPSHKKPRLDESVTIGSKNGQFSSEISLRRIPQSEKVVRNFRDTTTLNGSGPECTDNVGYTEQSISSGRSAEIPPIQIRIEKPITAEHQRSLPSASEQPAPPQSPTRSVKPTVDLVVEQVLEKVRSQTRNFSVQPINSTVNDTLSRPCDVMGTHNLLPGNTDQQPKDDNPTVLVLDEDIEIAERNDHVTLYQRNLHVPHTPEFDDNVNVDENILLDYSLEPQHATSTHACDSRQTATTIDKTAANAGNASATNEPVRGSRSTPSNPIDVTETVERPQAVNSQQTNILKDQNMESLPQATMTSATIIYNEINGDSEIQIEEIIKVKVFPNSKYGVPATDFQAKSEDQVKDKCDPQITVIDDDIQIVDNDTEFDATPSLTMNKQNHFCQVCNRGFRTSRAVQEHMSSHIFDAGATCEQTFGVPLRHIVYVCRSCCLAYEDSDVFAKHIKKHGLVFGCPRCTAVSFDQTQMQLHLEAHNNGKLVFGCVICRIAFRKEQNLLLHMNRMHDMNILWMCLKCFMANTDWAVMYSHVMTQHYSAYPVHPAKVLVPCATAKLHYQPIKPVEYESSLTLLTPAVRRLTAPAECPHRTFNTYNETLVACPVCGSMIAATRYLLENEDLRKVGQFKLLLVDETQEKMEQDLHPACVNKTAIHPNLTSAITIDDRTAPPNITIANALPRASLSIQNVATPLKYRKMSWCHHCSSNPNGSTKCCICPFSHQFFTDYFCITSFKSITPAATATPSQRPILAPMMTEISRLLSNNNNNNNNTTIAPGNQQPRSVSQLMPPYRPRRLNVSTASKPLATVAPSIPSIPTHSRTSTPSVEPPTTNRLRVPRPPSNVAIQGHVGPAPIQPTNASIICTICNVIVQNQAALKVHSMKHDPDKMIFCLECGYRTKSGHEFYEHIHKTHSSQLLTGVVTSTCDNCGEKFTSLNAYRNHVHPGLMRCDTCGLSCSTVTEQAAHNLRHGIHGSFCCPFCGSCFITELSMQRHMIRHCCEEWVMCRECGMCYKNIRLLALHFQTQHGKIHGATDMTCLPCNMNISTPQYHILTCHMVMALRMPRALYLDVKVFRTSTLSTPRIFDHRLFKQVYVCRVCKFNFVTALAAQKHHVSSHNGFAVFWTVTCSADVLLVDENTDCKCGHCSFGGQFKKLVPHLNAKHSVEQGIYFCGSCDDRFDNSHDLIYHTQFNHKISRKSMFGGDVQSGSDSQTVSEGSTSAHLVRFPNFSPLYCLLCGTCVADSAFVNHVASHRLPWSASGAISLHVCLVCGICFVETDAQILCAHALAHAVTSSTGTSDKFYEFPYVTCHCEIGNLKLDTEKSNSNTGGSTSNVASSSRQLPSQDNSSDITVIASADSTSIFEQTADCLEPPHCDICHSVLSWNGPKVLSHYLESHCTIESTVSLFNLHRHHTTLISAHELQCRICNFAAK